MNAKLNNPLGYWSGCGMCLVYFIVHYAIHSWIEYLATADSMLWSVSWWEFKHLSRTSTRLTLWLLLFTVTRCTTLWILDDESTFAGQMKHWRGVTNDDKPLLLLPMHGCTSFLLDPGKKIRIAPSTWGAPNCPSEAKITVRNALWAVYALKISCIRIWPCFP
jgi:hypothetical protein